MSARRMPAPLAVRSPFALDIHDLDRRPGSMRRLKHEVPAPAGWSVELVAVPQGAPVELDLRLESVMDGVLVSGTAEAPIAADCGRCLASLTTTVVAPLQELFAYEPDPEDEAIPVVAGTVIDLEPALRDAVVLALPLNPLCRADCPGLCPRCGTPLADVGPDHTHPDTDPRWAALARLRLDDTAEET